MIYGIVLGIHVVVCLVLVLVVLMQSSKGTGLAGGSAFGGGAESTMFGGRGAATFLSKATTVFGAAFMVTSLTLTVMGTRGGGDAQSAVQDELQGSPLGVPQSETAPPTPGTGGESPLPDVGVDGGAPLPDAGVGDPGAGSAPLLDPGAATGTATGGETPPPADPQEGATGP